jgi:hypothetical protein
MPSAIENKILREAGFLLSPGLPQNALQSNSSTEEYGPFAKSAGAIRHDGRFAICPTTEAGFTALDVLLSTPRYETMTIDAAIARLAPDFENNTSAYQASVRAAVGVSGDTPVSSLTARQTVALQHAIARVEGYYSSTVSVVIQLPQVPDKIPR